ncbi:MAG: hypothetical protein RIT45_3489, partial [Pseudomonadota bacterium]
RRQWPLLEATLVALGLLAAVSALLLPVGLWREWSIDLLGGAAGSGQIGGRIPLLHPSNRALLDVAGRLVATCTDAKARAVGGSCAAGACSGGKAPTATTASPAPPTAARRARVASTRRPPGLHATTFAAPDGNAFFQWQGGTLLVPGDLKRAARPRSSRPRPPSASSTAKPGRPTCSRPGQRRSTETRSAPIGTVSIWSFRTTRSVRRAPDGLVDAGPARRAADDAGWPGN